nr:Gag-Asp_proteas domain-containing protein [Tanacetum cinerariifolium]
MELERRGVHDLSTDITHVDALIDLSTRRESSKPKDRKIREWEGTIDFLVVPMDDFKVVLGLEFLDRVRAFPMPFANSLCILHGGKTCMVSTERDAKSEAKTLSAMQLKKGFNKSEPCYLAEIHGVAKDVRVKIGE